MTRQWKRRGLVCMQGDDQPGIRGWRVATYLAPFAVPLVLIACGSGNEPNAASGPSTPNTGIEPSMPSTVSESNGPNPDGAPGAGTEGAVEPTRDTEQPNPPMLQNPMGTAGGGDDDEDPAAEPPAAEQPAAQEPPAQEPSGETPELAADDVILIGDSYFEIPNQEFNRELSRLAREAGMIGDNESFRDHAISGTRLAGGFSPIPQQYANAQQQAPARVVVMDGGGNDIIQSQCVDCARVTNAIAAAAELLEQMADDGTVEQIIFFYYPDFPNFPALRADAMDFMRPRLQSICEESSVPCEFLDLRPIFVGHPEFTGPDNLHPSVAGSRATAQAVFTILQATPIAQ
jgi:lysophospholipase L1-like esterase